MSLPTAAISWRYVKAALRATEFALPAGYAYLSGLLSDGDASAASPGWVRAVVTFSRDTPTGTAEDKGSFKLDLINITSGALDSSWTSADLATVSTDLLAFLDAIKPNTGLQVTYDSVRYYAMGFNASDPGPGHRSAGAGAFVPTGPPLRIDSFTKTGTGGPVLPYQVAATCTFRTAWPKHWGRIYLPNPAMFSGACIDTKGRLVAGYQTAITTAVSNLYEALAGHDFLGVVPVTSVGKSAYHALLTIDEIVVDDVPDVQRRRRARQVASRSVVSAP